MREKKKPSDEFMYIESEEGREREREREEGRERERKSEAKEPN